MKNRKMLLGMIVLMLVSLVIVPLGSAMTVTTTTYSDDFNSYSDNSAPSQSWYTFWTNFTYAKVNRTIYASHPFFINMSTSPSVKKAVYFNFTTPYAFDSFSFYFTYLNNSAIKHNHTEMDFVLKGTSALVTIKVKGNGSTVAGNRNRLLILNSTGAIKKNVTIVKSLEYLVVYTPDWSHTNLNISVVNVSSGLPIAQCDVGIYPQSKLYGFYMYNYPASSRVCIFLENFELTKTVTTSALDEVDATTHNLLLTVLPVLIAVAIMVFIVSMAFTGGITKESLMTLMIIAILGIILIQIILNL